LLLQVRDDYEEPVYGMITSDHSRLLGLFILLLLLQVHGDYEEPAHRMIFAHHQLLIS
jgi:hypothetical protein